MLKFILYCNLFLSTLDYISTFIFDYIFKWDKEPKKQEKKKQKQKKLRKTYTHPICRNIYIHKFREYYYCVNRNNKHVFFLYDERHFSALDRLIYRNTFELKAINQSSAHFLIGALSRSKCIFAFRFGFVRSMKVTSINIKYCPI